MNKIKVAYFGSPSFSADLLEKIILDKTLPVEVILVVTQPDKPVGRKRILTASPVKIVAKKYGVKVLEDSDILSTWGTKGAPTGDKNSTVNRKIDLALVYAYGEILPKEILSLPKYGFLNVHPSLLPLYRGASPIAYPLIMGDKETGVSLMLMDEKMDHGPLIAQEKTDILPNETRTDLEIKLTNLGFEIVKKTLNKLIETKNAPKPHFQNHTRATYTKKLTKSDGFIPLTTLKKMVQNERVSITDLPMFIQNYITKCNIENSSKLLFNLFRGLSPWPGLWTLITLTDSSNSQKRLKITEIKIVEGKPTITQVQLEGKKEVDFNTFQKAYNLL